jgi:hypothetical protein
LLRLSAFISAAVAHLQVQCEADLANMGNLLPFSSASVFRLAEEKGSIRHLLDETWMQRPILPNLRLAGPACENYYWVFQERAK